MKEEIDTEIHTSDYADGHYHHKMPRCGGAALKEMVAKEITASGLYQKNYISSEHLVLGMRDAYGLENEQI